MSRYRTITDRILLYFFSYRWLTEVTPANGIYGCSEILKQLKILGIFGEKQWN